MCLAQSVSAVSESGTHVTFYLHADGSVSGFRAEGHSGYAAYGEDILCAAISALTQTTLLGLLNVIGIPVTYELDDEVGLVDVRVNN